MNVIRRTMKGSRGFTLVEIAIVVAIIGLLLLIALPLFSGARVRAYIAEARSLSSEWKALAWSCLVERNFRESRCDTMPETGWSAPLDSDVWDWNPALPGTGAFLACGTAGPIDASALGVCGGLADTTSSTAWIALVVPPNTGFIPPLMNYALVIATNTGRVYEIPADGSVVTTP